MPKALTVVSLIVGYPIVIALVVSVTLHVIYVGIQTHAGKFLECS